MNAFSNTFMVVIISCDLPFTCLFWVHSVCVLGGGGLKFNVNCNQQLSKLSICATSAKETKRKRKKRKKKKEEEKIRGGVGVGGSCVESLTQVFKVWQRRLSPHPHSPPPVCTHSNTAVRVNGVSVPDV